MTKERAWPAKAMYILIAAALAISLTIMMAPAQKASAAPDPGLSEWTRVDTPTTDGWVLAPCSVIIDYALAEAGEVAYAVVYQDEVQCPEPCGDFLTAEDDGGGDFLLKSDDYGATWDDITSAIEDALDDDEVPYDLLQVATDWVDPDFVAVALDIYEGSIHVLFSTDGGDTFEDIGEVEDGDVYLDYVSDLAVSYEVSDKRAIAIGGVAWDDDSSYYLGGLFRCIVTGDSAGNWEDATKDPGWDNMDAPAEDIFSKLVMDIIFSPSWATDKTILVTTFEDDWYDGDWPDYDSCGDDGNVYMQCGSWGNSEGWNEMSTLGIEAVSILEDEYFPIWLMNWDARSIAGITLPEDYNSKNTDDRVLWVWVNYYDEECGVPMCTIMRVDDDSADPVGPLGQVEDGELWLTNISYHGTIAEGEALAGVLGTGTYEESESELLTECCPVVQVYRNDGIHNMDICCERWQDACKPPTGVAGMAVSYVGEDKAYAVALWGEPCNDEGAWSMTFDDGDTWNQLSLIDTYIHYFTDAAVSPDCNKTFLVSVNKVEIGYCSCDSVWLHADTLPEAEEYSDQWLRTWSGHLEEGWGLLRLAPEETTGDTVFLVDMWTSNVYRNDLETLACWDPIGATSLDEIVDLAAQDADTVFALDYNGDVAMWDDDEWGDAVESEVDAGWTIAVWGDYILVGGFDGEVTYCDDFLADEPEFTALDDVPYVGDNCKVTVAFDTYFDTNMTVYAATEAWKDTGNTPLKSGGIYSYVIDESEEWTDLKAEPLESQIGVNDGDAVDETVDVAFTGLVVDRPGNPYTDADNGGVIYATYYGYVTSVVNNQTVETWFTGVARSLERDVNVCTTCLQWDFLHVGLTPGPDDCKYYPEIFEAEPDALKICGCLTPDTTTHLFALDSDWWNYDFCDNDFGSLWTYEDCYSKKAPEITSPEDGAIISPDACLCQSGPFTVLWDSLCDACSYDIAFALDEDFTMPVAVPGQTELVYHIVSDTPSFSVPAGLSAETSYYIRVRAADAATGEIIHSWWSDPIEITTAAFGEAGTIHLVAPEPGALNQPIKSLGFSWNLAATWDSFDWVLSANADLSSPLDSKTGLTSTATSYAGTLQHGTTYYWQVTAYNEGTLISTSAIGTFTTGALGPYCDPTTGLCFDTEQQLKDYQASQPTPGTPFWVWVVIGIGAVLVIVVIVLIFRTRRV
jgi:hypothetical protein